MTPDEKIALLARTLQEYADHRVTCPARDDRHAACECGATVAVAEALRVAGWDNLEPRGWL